MGALTVSCFVHQNDQLLAAEMSLKRETSLFSDEFAVELTARAPPADAVDPFGRARDLFQIGFTLLLPSFFFLSFFLLLLTFLSGQLLLPDRPTLGLMHGLYLWDFAEDLHQAKQLFIDAVPAVVAGDVSLDMRRVYYDVAQTFSGDEDFQENKYKNLLRS